MKRTFQEHRTLVKHIDLLALRTKPVELADKNYKWIDSQEYSYGYESDPNIVNNSVVLGQLLLATLDLCLKATSSESAHIFPLVI